jgi:hypothetical protein
MGTSSVIIKYVHSKQQKTKFLLNSCTETSRVHFSISLTSCHLTLNATQGRRERMSNKHEWFYATSKRVVLVTNVNNFKNTQLIDVFAVPSLQVQQRLKENTTNL